MKLFIVILFRKSAPAIVGVFDSEKAAIAACRTPRHGYGKVELNHDSGDDAIRWQVTYPLEDTSGAE